MTKRKEKYKENLKQIGNEALDDLEPVVKSSGYKLLDIVKEIFNDIISDLFNRRKGKKDEEN